LELGVVTALKGYVQEESLNTPFLKLRYPLSKEVGLFVTGDMAFIVSIANVWPDKALTEAIS